MHKLYIFLLFVMVGFFSCQSPQQNKIQVDVLAKSTKSWNDSILRPYAEGQPEVTILKITIPPHTTLPWHKHPFINVAVVLEGTLKVVSKDGDSTIIHKGQSLVELVDKFHYGKNEGNTDVVLIVFYAGIEGKPITVPE